MQGDPDDPRLRSSLRQLADRFASAAPGEDQVLARLEQRLRRRQVASLLFTVAAAVLVVIAVLGLPSLLGQRNVASPSFPPVSGVFVTQRPDDAGRCYAVRLYETTPRDGRVALWTWEGPAGCGTRSGSLLLGTGAATAVAAGSSTGIRLESGTDARGGLAGFSRVVIPSGESLEGYPNADEAAARRAGIPWRRVEALDVPYQP